MQNTEIDDIENQKVAFTLENAEGKEYDEKVLLAEKSYTVLWFDPKMKNYISFLEFLEKKKFI